MDETEANSIFGSNYIRESLRAFYLPLNAWANSTETNGNSMSYAAKNDPSAMDDNKKTNSANIIGNPMHGTTNNGQTVDELETLMRKLKISDFCLPPNAGAIPLHDKFATNKNERHQRPPAQKKWSSKSPTGKEFCVFCKNNGEPDFVFNSHKVKDNRNRVCCPRLRGYRCRICGASGDSAHTVRYCPEREKYLRSAAALMVLTGTSLL